MTVRELNQEQYKELCQAYITEFWTDDEEGSNSPSYDDLIHADELVTEDVIYRYYEGITFTEDDFFCSKEE
jgi:hypothetical protein